MFFLKKNDEKSIIDQLRSRTGNDGWYHNIKLFNSFTWNIYGRRKNATHVDPNAFNQLFEEITVYISKHLDFTHSHDSVFNSKVVLDIGPAEGFYTFAALEKGAKKVIIIQPSNLSLTKRLFFLAKIKGLSNCIENISAFFPNLKRKEFELINTADIVFCLGVLYHAQNVNNFLDSLIELNKLTILEFSHTKKGKDARFDPANHMDGFKVTDSKDRASAVLIDIDYVLSYIRDKFKIVEMVEYNSRCMDSSYLASYNYGCSDPDAIISRNYTRSAFVLIPK